MMSSSKLRVVKEPIIVKPVGMRGVDDASKVSSLSEVLITHIPLPLYSYL